MKLSNKLTILMNGYVVGFLEKSSKGLQFTYDQQWLDNTDLSRPISLSMPLVQKTYSGDIVYNFFENLLPDNAQIKARVQAKFQVATDQPYELLAKIGRDCVGAIQVIEGAPIAYRKSIQVETLTEREIASVLKNYQNPLGMTENSDFRITIAGAQEKTAFLYYKKKWCRPLDETPTSHIFKLPIGFIQHQQIDLSDSCENEWLCMQIAKAYGLPVAPCEILYFNDVKVLVVERFDRKLAKDKTWIMRLPQEDMCQALGVSPHLKYQADGGPGISDIMKLLLGSTHAEHDRDIFFRSQVLFWLLAAIDGHAKNFSIFIEPKGKYHLTPLYDVISAYPLIEKKQLQKQKIKMAMALKGSSNHYHWYHVQRGHFLSTAKAAGFSIASAEAILNAMLNQTDQVIENVLSELPLEFPKNISEPIFSGMLRMKNQLNK